MFITPDAVLRSLFLIQITFFFGSGSTHVADLCHLELDEEVRTLAISEEEIRLESTSAVSLNLLQRNAKLHHSGTVLVRTTSHLDTFCSPSTIKMPHALVAILVPLAMLAICGCLSVFVQKVTEFDELPYEDMEPLQRSPVSPTPRLLLVFLSPRRPAVRFSSVPRAYLDENLKPRSINFGFVYWSAFANFMSCVNFVAFIPIAVNNFDGSLSAAGCLVGLSAVGSCLSLPLFANLGADRPRLALLCWALCMTSGNACVIKGAFAKSLVWLQCGRLVSGAAYSYKLHSDDAVLQWIPKWDRAGAVFTLKMAMSLGMAVGSALPPLCDIVLRRLPPVQQSLPSFNAAAVSAPFALMAGSAFVFILTLIFFPNVEELSAEALGNAPAAGPANTPRYDLPRERTTRAIFLATLSMQLLTPLIRDAWTTGSILLLSRYYCIAPIAGIVTCLVALSLVTARVATTKMVGLCEGDAPYVIKGFGMLGLIALACLFSYTRASTGGLALFLIGSVVLFVTGAAQAGAAHGLGEDSAVASSRYLNRSRFNMYWHLAGAMGSSLGPFLTLTILEYNRHLQTTLATLLASVSLLQVVTFFVLLPSSSTKSALDK